jgi:hypothetical protein
MSFFSKKIDNVKITKQTTSILEELYAEIYSAYTDSLKNKSISSHIGGQIQKPKTFLYNTIPPVIRSYIETKMSKQITYTIHMSGRLIKIHFIVEEVKPNLSKYNKYADNVKIWLHFLNNNAAIRCSRELDIYFYMTPFTKHLPTTNTDVLDAIHVNTGVTTTCPPKSEILVYRKEEWFKVFIHETIHNFGLDFSDMNTKECTRILLQLFPVNSNVNLFESYTECWAELMNTMFCSFNHLDNKLDIDIFINNAVMLLDIERAHSVFQMVKVLDFMGLTYSDLYSKKSEARDQLYKENTNVLSYYVVKTILLMNYPLFLGWCKLRNEPMIQFTKTLANQKSYCDLIHKLHKNRALLSAVKYYEHRKSDTNLKMSICEIG